MKIRRAGRDAVFSCWESVGLTPTPPGGTVSAGTTSRTASCTSRAPLNCPAHVLTKRDLLTCTSPAVGVGRGGGGAAAAVAMVLGKAMVLWSGIWFTQ